MVTSARYCDLVRERRDAYNHRLQLVESAKQRGIKPTAQLFTTSPLTVRKGWRRYPQHGPSGLQEHSRAPHRHPLKTSADVERQVLTSATWLCSGSGASTACGNHEGKNINASKISRTAKRSGPYSSRAAPIPRILPTSPTTGRRRSSFAYPSSNTPRAKCAAGYGSGLSPKNAAPLPTRSSLRASSSFWSVAASRFAICSGRPTTAGNAKATSQKLSATASTCASRLPHTPIRATWKRFIAWRKTSSSSSKSSERVESSSPKCPVSSCTSTSYGPTRTKKISALGKSENESRYF